MKLLISILILSFVATQAIEYPYTTNRTCAHWFINTTSEFSNYYKEINDLLVNLFQYDKVVTSQSFKFLKNDSDKEKLYNEIKKLNYIAKELNNKYYVRLPYIKDQSWKIYCPENKCIRYPIPKKYWQYQYQMLINNILTKSEDTKTKININDFYVLDKELADDLISSLKYDNYIRDIDGDMYAIHTSKTIGCNKDNNKNIKIVNAKVSDNKNICDNYSLICNHTFLLWIIIIVSIIKLLIKCNEKEKK